MQKINFFKNKNYQFYLIISAIFLTALIGFSGLVVKYNKYQQTDIKQEAINISKNTINHIRKDKDQLKQELKALKTQYIQKQEEIKNINDNLQTKHNDLTTNINEKKALENKLNDTIKEKNNFSDKMKDLDNKIKELNNDINNFNNDLTNKNNEINNLKNEISNKSIEIQQLKQNNNFTNQEIIKHELIPSALKDVISLIDDKPYTKYLDKEGNTIREYRFFKNLKPVAKDIHGRYNFFSKEDFKKEAAKLNNMYPIMFTEGKHDIGNQILDKNNKSIEKYGWKLSKSNYQLILTNKPDNTTELLTKNKEGDNGFYNQSYCYLDTLYRININFKENGFFKSYNNNNYPYMRFMTKNLKIKFDYMQLINQLDENKDSSNNLFYKLFTSENDNLNCHDACYYSFKSCVRFFFYTLELFDFNSFVSKCNQNNNFINQLNDINNKLPDNLKFSYLIKEFDIRKEYPNVFNKNMKIIDDSSTFFKYKFEDIKPIKYIDNISFNKQAWAEHLKTLNINKDDKNYDLRINLIYNLTRDIYDPANKYKISDGSIISIPYTSIQKQQNKNPLPTLEQ